MFPVTYLESSSTAWITAVANVYTTESRIIRLKGTYMFVSTFL
jgi:hypothetical protein